MTQWMHGLRAALATTAAALTIGCAVAATASAQAPPSDGSSATPAAPARIESALVTEMNRARVERGRKPLRTMPALQRPARGQSRYLLGLGVLDHDGPDGSPFWTRLIAAGFPRNRSMGENLAMVPACGPDAAVTTVRLWLHSPGHRANLLNPDFHWVGGGAASAADCSATVLTADYGS